MRVVFSICAAIMLCGIVNEWRLRWQRKSRIRKFMAKRERELAEDAHMQRVIDECVRELRAAEATKHLWN